MINANELTVGSWVNVKELGKVQVSAICRNAWVEVAYYKHDVATTERKDFRVYFDGINPIQLTPEILEAAGLFRVYSDKHIYQVGLITFVFADDKQLCLTGEDEEAYFGCRDIEYLHQLQNIYYSLTGQELTINLHAAV